LKDLSVKKIILKNIKGNKEKEKEKEKYILEQHLLLQIHLVTN